jgi:hypothetical protein
MARKPVRAQKKALAKLRGRKIILTGLRHTLREEKRGITCIIRSFRVPYWEKVPKKFKNFFFLRQRVVAQKTGHISI